MHGTTHMAGGASAAAAYLLLHSNTIQSPPMILAAMGAGALGSLLPDIDHPKSKISRMLPPVSGLVSLISSHRGLFHTPVLYLPFWSVQTLKCHNLTLLLWSNLVFLGIASHLFLDFLNPGGIPLLWPFETKRRHIAKIKTGGKTESVLRIILYILCAILLAVLLLPGLLLA